MDNDKNMRYYVETDDQNGDWIPGLTNWSGDNFEIAREQYLLNTGCPRFATRRLMSINMVNGDQVELESRTIFERIDGPVTYGPRILRMLQRWADHGSMVAMLLQNCTQNLGMDYIELDGELFTFLPDGKSPELTNGKPFGPKNRQAGKPARVAKKILTPEALVGLMDTDFEEFANVVKADLENAMKVMLVKGEDIRFWYHHINSDKTREFDYNPIHHSCANSTEQQKFLDIYVENPDKIQMAIMLSENGLLIGRALVWTLDNGHMFMDRIYAPQKLQPQFVDFAKKNLSHIRPVGERAKIPPDWPGHPPGPMFVTVKPGMYRGFPHIDTFTYFDHETGRLTDDRRRKYTLALTTTTGGYGHPPAGTIWPPEDGGPPISAHPCSNCRARTVDEMQGAEQFEGDVYCLRCLDRYFGKCCKCEQRTRQRYQYGAKEYCRRCFDQSFFKCYYCHEVRRLDGKEVRGGDRIYCKSCSEQKNCYCNSCHHGFTVMEYNMDRYMCLPCTEEVDSGRKEIPTEEEPDQIYDEDDYLEDEHYDDDDDN